MKTDFSPRALIIATILTVVVGASAGYFHVRHVLAGTRHELGLRLQAVNDSKVAKLEAWRQERLNDARTLTRLPGLGASIAEFSAHPEDSVQRTRLYDYLESYRRIYGYNAIVLLDRALKPVLASPVSANPQEAANDAVRQEALRASDVLFVDLHLGGEGVIHMDLIAPVRSANDQSVVGVVLLRLAASDSLYPLLRQWADAGDSAETVLIRSEGKKIVYLNELRHRKDTALKLRMPLDQPDFLPAKVLRAGQAGLIEGVDYQGVPVLGVASTVPGSPWVMISKIDREEAFAEAYRELYKTLGLYVLGGVCAGFFLRILSRRRQRIREQWQFTQELTESKIHAQEIERLNRIYQVISSVNQAIARRRTQNELFAELCRILVDAGGFKLAWVGWHNPATKQLDAVAIAGDEHGYMADLRIPSDPGMPGGNSPAAVAFRENRVDICNDFLADPRTQCRHEAARRVGISTAIALPLRREGVPVGILTVYAAERNFFNERKIALLEECTRDMSFALDVMTTERRHREAVASLSASEERFYKLVRSIPGVAVQGYTLDGTTTYWNDASEKLYGYTAQEAVGRNLLDLIIPPPMRDGVRQAMRHMAETGKAIPSSELTLMRKDGSAAEVYSSHAIVQMSGEPAELFCLDIDITERKQAAAAVAKSHSLLSAALESTNDGILVVSTSGEVTSFNQRFLTLWQIPEKEMAARNDRQLRQFVLDQLENPEAFEAKVAELYANPEVSHMDNLTFKDGRIFERYCLPQRIGERIVGRVWSFRDITERKRSEAAMLESEERFRSVVEGSAMPIFVSLDMNFSYLNPAALQLMGAETAELLIGQPVLSRIHPAYHESIKKRAERVFRGERKVAPPQEEIYIRLDGSQVKVEATASPITYQGQPGAVVFVQDITTRKQAEMKLRQFSRIVEQAPISIAIANLEGTIEYANPTFCAVSGYTLPELLGQNPRVLKSGLTAPNVFADMWATLRRGEVWRGELTNKKKDGQLYDELAVISPVTDEQGKPTHYVALKQDITARKAGENALRDSEARFRELFDLETDAIMVTDTETGRFLQVNEAAAATYGYSVDEMLNLDSAVITAEPEKTRELYKALRQNADQAIEVPVRLHRKRDGTVFPVDIKIRSFVRNGRQIHVSVNRDITAQIKAREQLERFNVELENKVALRTEEIAARNHEIEALLRSIPDMVMRMRRDGTVLNFQPAKGETPLARVAMTSTVMANQSSHSLKPLMNAAFPLGLRAVAEKTAVAVETEIAFGSASLTAELRVAPIGTEEFVVFARDITERKRFEAAMVAMLDKERQMSEMKTRFISVTSHEFRTPMAAAMASAELLHNHPDRITPAKREELFVRIAVSFRRMMEMLDDVLLLNRMDADKVDVKLCSIDVKKSIQSYIDEIRLGDKDAHHFEFHSIGDTTHFATDPNLLHHILANLLSNAVRYSLPGTVVTTRLTAEPGKMRIMVEDQGIGIPEEDRARIFESFERGSNVGTIKGTGLGLNIVKRMTGLLGGTIEVDAIEGGGSRFTVTFPRA